MKNFTNKTRQSLTAIGLIMALGLGTGYALASPGGNHNDAIGKPGQEATVDRVIEISLDDNYFDPESIEIRSGETIKFILSNQGDGLHEFNLGTPEMHEAHQEEMAEMMESMNMDGMDHGSMMGMDHDSMGMSNMDKGNMEMGGMEHDSPNSVFVQPGEQAELIWTFGEADNLEFACNVPGHYDSGMVGAFKQAGPADAS
ncbi:putative cupredoxin-like copper-binding protein [Aestuariispira insulae]|uniref:Putative cupredoxin-like copper-binding protein n=2 Tax=Aestuariispira insulae TaxID=1461337 RepID=A0A3D9HE66_9PROT|nr:putative cupredoxin-like copper-binding protein [Aestuariispira insulae]